MERIEKYRKLSKYIQYGGMIVILLGGMAGVYFFGMNQSTTTDNFSSLSFIFGAVILLFCFMMFVMVPMQTKLTNIIIEESVKGLVESITFDKKKGYSKESFIKLGLCPSTINQYTCSNYYVLKYQGSDIESVTVKAYDEYTVPKQPGVKGSKKHKEESVYFLGRVYILPLDIADKFNVYGKKLPGSSRKKEMEEKEYNSLIPLKVKKQEENFEVFYKEGVKPSIDVQKFIDKLLTLKLQAKGPVSAFVRSNSVVLCIDNGHFYEEVDVKNPVNENLVRDYRKDVSMVLNFVNAIKKDLEEK